MVLVDMISPLTLASRPDPSLKPVLLFLHLCLPQHLCLCIHHTQTPLLPPHLVNTCYRVILHLHKQIQYRADCDALCNRVLEAGEISLQLLQPYLRHRLRHRGVTPATISAPPLLFSHHPEVHLMVKKLRRPANVWGHGTYI